MIQRVVFMKILIIYKLKINYLKYILTCGKIEHIYVIKWNGKDTKI